MSKLLILLTALLALSCASPSTDKKVEPSEYPMVVIKGESRAGSFVQPAVFIVIDTEHGIEYIVVETTTGLAITPRIKTPK